MAMVRLLFALSVLAGMVLGGVLAAEPGDPWLESVIALAELVPAEFPPFTGLPPALDAGQSGELLFRDDFSEDAGRWSLEPGDEGASAYVDGAYVMTPPLGLRVVSLSDWEGGDFLVEADAARIAGAEYGFAAGLVFRYVDPDNYYCFEAGSDGRYWLGKRVDGESSLLAEPTESALIPPGADFAVRLGALARGGRLTLLLNGTEVQTVEDGDLASGALGLAARSPQRQCSGLDCVNPAPAAIAFDNVAVRAAPVALPGPVPLPAATPTAVATPADKGLPPTVDSLNIDWSALHEEFDIRNLRVEEVLEASMAVPALFVLFEFEAVRDVGLVDYTAAFINAQGKVISAASVEFRPDLSQPAAYYDALGGWKAGMRGSGRFRLLDELSKTARVRLVRNQ